MNEPRSWCTCKKHSPTSLSLTLLLPAATILMSKVRTHAPTREYATVEIENCFAWATRPSTEAPINAPEALLPCRVAAHCHRVQGQHNEDIYCSCTVRVSLDMLSLYQPIVLGDLGRVNLFSHWRRMTHIRHLCQDPQAPISPPPPPLPPPVFRVKISLLAPDLSLEDAVACLLLHLPPLPPCWGVLEPSATELQLQEGPC